MPATRALPADGNKKPAKMRSAVVFPAPFSPSRPSTSPGRTAKETSRSACTPPANCLQSPVTSSAFSSCCMGRSSHQRVGHWQTIKQGRTKKVPKEGVEPSCPEDEGF